MNSLVNSRVNPLVTSLLRRVGTLELLLRLPCRHFKSTTHLPISTRFPSLREDRYIWRRTSSPRTLAGVSTPAIEESLILEIRSPLRGPESTDSGHANCGHPVRCSIAELRGMTIGRNCRIAAQELIEVGVQVEWSASKAAREGRPAMAPAAVAAAAPMTEPRTSFSSGSHPFRWASM